MPRHCPPRRRLTEPSLESDRVVVRADHDVARPVANRGDQVSPDLARAAFRRFGPELLDLGGQSAFPKQGQ